MPNTKSKTIQSLVDDLKNINALQYQGIESASHPHNVSKAKKDATLKIKLLQEKYKDKYLQYGNSVDNVLKELEDYIVKRIDKLAPGTGELARSDEHHRLQTTPDDLGYLHTALRALLDEKVLIIDGFGYPSLLHRGSNATYIIEEELYSMRLILAYYYFAAFYISDFSEAYGLKNLTDPQKIAQAKEDSINHFIWILYDIRRAHNETDLQYPDAPACSPGTFTQIVTKCAIYNELTTISSSEYDKIPKIIQDFILEKLRQEPLFVRQAAYQFISKYYYEDEYDEQSKLVFYSFVDSLSSHDRLRQLLQYLTENLERPLSQEEENIIKQILFIFQENLKPEFYRTDLNADFWLQILRASELKEESPVLQLELRIKYLSYHVLSLVQSIENESKLKWLTNELKDKDKNFIGYKSTEESQNNEIIFENIKKSYNKELLALIEILNNLNISDTSIKTKIESKLNKIGEQLNFKPYEYLSSATYTDWENHFKHLLFRKNLNKIVVPNEIELKRMVDWMSQSLSDIEYEQFLTSLYQELKSQISKGNILCLEEKRIFDVLNFVFCSNPLSELSILWNSIKSRYHYNTLNNVIRKFFPTENEILKELAKTSFFIDSEQLKNWNKKAWECRLENNSEKLSYLVILTLFNHFELIEIPQATANGIKAICEVLCKHPDWKSESNSHLYWKALFMTLEKIKPFFQMGHVIISNSEIAEDELKKSNQERQDLSLPIAMFRTNSSNPTELALSVLKNENGVITTQHYFIHPGKPFSLPVFIQYVKHAHYLGWQFLNFPIPYDVGVPIEMNISQSANKVDIPPSFETFDISELLSVDIEDMKLNFENFESTFNGISLFTDKGKDYYMQFLNKIIALLSSSTSLSQEKVEEDYARFDRIMESIFTSVGFSVQELSRITSNLLVSLASSVDCLVECKNDSKPSLVFDIKVDLCLRLLNRIIYKQVGLQQKTITESTKAEIHEYLLNIFREVLIAGLKLPFISDSTRQIPISHEFDELLDLFLKEQERAFVLGWFKEFNYLFKVFKTIINYLELYRNGWAYITSTQIINNKITKYCETGKFISGDFIFRFSSNSPQHMVIDLIKDAGGQTTILDKPMHPFSTLLKPKIDNVLLHLCSHPVQILDFLRNFSKDFQRLCTPKGEKISIENLTLANYVPVAIGQSQGNNQDYANYFNNLSNYSKLQENLSNLLQGPTSTISNWSNSASTSTQAQLLSVLGINSSSPPSNTSSSTPKSENPSLDDIPKLS